MAEIAEIVSIPDEKRCKRTDGRKWRCRNPVEEGRGYCTSHYKQGLCRQKKQPVPNHLKLDRARRSKFRPKLEGESSGGSSDATLRRGKRTRKERSDDVSRSGLPQIDTVKEEVIINVEVDQVVSEPEKKFDKSQQLHMIRELLPVIEKLNQEKISELDTEAKNKGTNVDQLEVHLTNYSQKTKCSYCSACITDVHRRCICCPFVLCILCCQDFRNGCIHMSLEFLKRARTKKSSETSWSLCTDGSIICPPNNVGGCGAGLLNLTSFYPFSLTKNLEATAKQIVSNYKSNKPFEDALSPCLLCDINNETGSEKVGNLIKKKGLYFSTKQEFIDKNLDHFITHWGDAQPYIIRDVLKSQADLNWDFGFMLCEYLEKSAETGTSESDSDWCEVEFIRKQIFARGTTYENVWNEFLKFKLRFSSGLFQDQFPNNYTAVMQDLPLQEYINPFTGFLNLAAQETQNPNLGFYVDISYGVPENVMDSDVLTNLRCHAYDMVNILAHATLRCIPERKINEVKMLMHKYSTKIKSSKKIKKRERLEGLFAESSGLEDTCNAESSGLEDTRTGEVHLISDDSSSDDTDDEDISQDTCGAQWDIFRREDVPKLLEYLRKYSNKLSRSYGSPKKVVHPLFDEIFYLEDYHKLRLKEEFNVEAWSFDQDVGEAVIIPAGCPYQMKKVKSCVNVIVEFISPESALECIKVSDEVRQLPVNHKAKGKMVEVKKMVIDNMHTAIEEISKVSETE